MGGEPSMTLGERDGMTTAIPSNGLIAFLRPLGLAGVVLMRGRFCNELLGVRTGATCFSCVLGVSGSLDEASCCGVAVALGFFGVPLLGGGCLFFAPGGRPTRPATLTLAAEPLAGVVA